MEKTDLHSSWLDHLKFEFEQPYMVELEKFLLAEKVAGKKIYPESENLFNALNFTPLDQLRVVILGQDPYHGPNQAHGLSFSVPKGERIPPSLMNIYKEIYSNLGIETPKHGNLTDWAKQGVLLLNSVMTVEHAQAASHRKRGWEQFTDSIISLINDHCQHIVFLLWGSYAQKKGQMIDPKKHLVLTAPHPSPLSAHRGFLGCEHFSKTNQYLLQHNLAAINWSNPE